MSLPPWLSTAICSVYRTSVIVCPHHSFKTSHSEKQGQKINGRIIEAVCILLGRPTEQNVVGMLGSAATEFDSNWPLANAIPWNPENRTNSQRTWEGT
jgi:hypothetical protein